MVVLELGPNFGYVLGTVVASALVHHGYMAFGVVAARKKYKVKYPALYATAEEHGEANAKAFNCVQRGHQNSLENQPAFLALLLAAGVKYPITSSVLGMTYVVSRCLYFSGYSTGNPDARYRGGLNSLAFLGLLVTAGKFAFDLLVSK